MKAHSIRIAGSLLFGACALAACGGNGSYYGNFPNVQCAYPTGTVVALAYPAPGAVGVPDSPGQVVIAASPALPNTWQVVLQVPGGGAGYEALLNTIAPSAVPTPFATPSFANPVYETSGLTSGLPSATTVTVLLNNTASNCNTYPTVGSFTTQ